MCEYRHGHTHDHSDGHGSMADATDRGLWGFAGFERYEDRVEGLTEYFPVLSAAVPMGLGFVTGLL